MDLSRCSGICSITGYSTSLAAGQSSERPPRTWDSDLPPVVGAGIPL